MSLKNEFHTKICVMCGEEKESGITINRGFICGECEKEIVHTDVRDEKYMFFIRKMKNLWVKNA